VQRRRHSLIAKEKSCLCTFILSWLQGPNAGNLTATTIEDICIVQSEGELDPVLVSFLEMAKGKIDLFSSRSVSASKGVSSMAMVPELNRSELGSTHWVSLQNSFHVFSYFYGFLSMIVHLVLSVLSHKLSKLQLNI